MKNLTNISAALTALLLSSVHAHAQGQSENDMPAPSSPSVPDVDALSVDITAAAIMLIGIAFVMVEATLPSFGIIGLFGLIAFLFGGAVLLDIEGLPEIALHGGLVAGIAVSAILIIALTIFLIVRAYQKKATTGPESLIGSMAEIVEWNGMEGRVHIQGEVWKAFSDRTLELNKENKVLVCAVEGLELKIRTTE